LIITLKSYYNFLDSGLLEQLEADNSKIPTQVLESIHKSEKESAEKDLTLKTSFFIVNLHKKNFPLSEILELTELDEEEVKRIIQEYDDGELS